MLSKETYSEHLKKEHQTSPLADYLEQCVYGGNDGIVTTFAVVAGFSGANMGAHTLNLSVVSVLLFGLANLIADGAAMGLGNFLSVKSAKKLYRNMYNKELQETKDAYAYEIAETEYIFTDLGFSKADAKTLTGIVSKNTNYWVRFMVQHECNMENKDNENPFKDGLATFLSFVFFGFIPLIPYFFSFSIDVSFYLSIGFTVLALVALGILRSIVVKDALLVTIVETVIIGSVAASLAYLVGMVFK